MTQFPTKVSNSHCTYPGEFIPAPLTLDELQHSHEGESKPLINIADILDAFIIEVAAPGLTKGDFYVSINEDILTIFVPNKEKEIATKKYYQHEFNYRGFEREIVLPGNIDADFFIAVYEDGILSIRLPKCKMPVMNHVERMIIY